jgi:hypothetical protein
VTEGTLDNLPALTRDAKPPALLIVGQVVRLRSRLAWFGAEKSAPKNQGQTTFSSQI